MKYPNLNRKPNLINVDEISSLDAAGRKKILVTGGGHAELPLIDAAHELGYCVITTGNNTEGPGHIAADAYIPGDFSDREFIYNLAKDINAVGLISGCNDFAYMSTAYAGEKLGLKGHDSFEVSAKVHHKNEFRKAMLEAGIRVPKVVEIYAKEDVAKVPEEIGFPVVIKPTDLTGGKGVVICHTIEDAQKAAEEALKITREKNIIAEEYIDGTNHGCSMLIKNHKAVCYIVDKEQYFKNKFLVAGAATPSELPKPVISELVNQMETMAEFLGLCDGLFHMQFIVDSKGPVLIDPCRRAPGDLYLKLAYYGTGVDFAMEIVKAELGLPIQDSYDMQQNFVARECILPDESGVVDKVFIDKALEEKLVYSFVWSEPGDIVEDAMKYRGGILVSRYDSLEEMNQQLENYHQLARIEVR